MRRMMIMLTYAVVDRVTRLGVGALGGASFFGSTVCEVEVPRKQRSQLGLELKMALLRTQAALYQTISSPPERQWYDSQLHRRSDP